MEPCIESWEKEYQKEDQFKEEDKEKIHVTSVEIRGEERLGREESLEADVWKISLRKKIKKEESFDKRRNEKRRQIRRSGEKERHLRNRSWGRLKEGRPGRRLFKGRR